MKNTIQAVVNQPIDKVFTTILSIIASKGYVITSSQKEGGLISFNTPRTIKTWGYNFNCTLIEKDANNTEVYLAGELKRYAITDWGEGDKIANNILLKYRILFFLSSSISLCS